MLNVMTINNNGVNWTHVGVADCIEPTHKEWQGLTRYRHLAHLHRRAKATVNDEIDAINVACKLRS